MKRTNKMIPCKFDNIRKVFEARYISTNNASGLIVDFSFICECNTCNSSSCKYSNSEINKVWEGWKLYHDTTFSSDFAGAILGINHTRFVPEPFDMAIDFERVYGPNSGLLCTDELRWFIKGLETVGFPASAILHQIKTVI